MLRFALTVSLVTTIALTSACGSPGKPPANKNKTTTPPTTTTPTTTTRTTTTPTTTTPTAKTLDDLGRLLVAAIHKGDESAAFRLLPTLAEMKQVGLMHDASEEKYKEFLAKRRRGFARVVAKFRRKYPSGCKQLDLSRLVKKDAKMRGKIKTISSIDLFAKCDGREIWLADPDMLLRTSAGWRLLEFS
jgi:hypothetical protein